MGEKVSGVVVLRHEEGYPNGSAGNGTDFLTSDKGWGPWHPKVVDAYVYPPEIVDELKTLAKDWKLKPEEIAPATFDLETGEVIITGERKPFTW